MDHCNLQRGNKSKRFKHHTCYERRKVYGMLACFSYDSWEFFIVRSGTAHTGKNPVRSIDRPDDYENNEDGGGVFIDGRSRGLSPTGNYWILTIAKIPSTEKDGG
jgi:hypothetical protein